MQFKLKNRTLTNLSVTIAGTEHALRPGAVEGPFTADAIPEDVRRLVRADDVTVITLPAPTPKPRRASRAAEVPEEKTENHDEQ